jgi:hypothetical protein
MKKEMSQLAWGATTLVIMVALGVVDWLTGDELNFFVFYFLPVSIGAWFLGLMASVSLAIFSDGVWFAADALTGHVYSSSFYVVWDIMVRLVALLAMGWCVSKIKQLLDTERETAESLRRSLSQIKVLETFLPICAQCKKIRNQNGVWQQLEIYIGEHSNTQFSHSYCPECAKKIMIETGLVDR